MSDRELELADMELHWWMELKDHLLYCMICDRIFMMPGWWHCFQCAK